ncbi:Fe-S cluster assembly protein SufD [Bacillus oleivorans]|uniref:Fe-S cluster assembly protein SufD n=1 Tax=Bacillus oleivorans TaxID=1448271 RepID=A0A285CXL3_9BACI|nr:Fe-S cluster assembly protein SufD [Bacillus oleivorans]SNX72304.1 Fe-S cluster assembly protein SufD [Bacillus oleivorans]
MTLDIKRFDAEYIRTFSKEQKEPDWLLEMRLKGLELSQSLPLPKPDKTKIDKWNFTQFEELTSNGAVFQNFEELPNVAKALINLEEQKNLYVQKNNQPAYLQLSPELKDQGVIFTDIFTAAREHGEILKKYFMVNGVNVDEHKLTALHTAFMNGGAFLYVPKNVEIKEPIQAVYIHDDANVSLFNHVIVVADDHSSVTYVENYISPLDESKAIVNIIAEVIANTNARITFGAVDNLAHGTTTYVNRRGVAGKDGTIEWALGFMNDGDTISENVTNLIGDGSNGDTKSVVVGSGDQKQNFTTKVVHFGKNSNGHILKHGVMKDEASSIFNGIGKIEHGASKSDAQQESRVLMLSEKARGDANPILLIDEDDVTAGHAASVGRVDPIQLYYLMSRGISKRQAEKLIIFGFLAPVVNQLPIEGVKKQLVEVIERKVH